MWFPRIIKTQRGKLNLGEVDVIRRRFAIYLRPHRMALLAAFLACFGAVAMQVASPWPIKLVFDVVISDAMADTAVGQWFAAHAADKTVALAIICGCIVLIALAEASFCYVRDILLARTGQQVVGKLRQSLFRHMQRLSPDVFESRLTGDLLMRLTGDIQMLRQMIVNAWITAGQNLLTILAIIAVMFWLNPFLALVATATIPLIAWSTVRISKRLRKVSANQREKESFVAAVAHEVLGAIMTVQAFNREKIESQRFARQNRASIRAGLNATRLEAKLFRIVTLSSAVGMCAVLFLGVRSVLSGVMTAGDLLVFVAYVRAINKPLRKLSKLAGHTAKATACGMRVAEILNIPPAIQDAPDAIVAERVRPKIELRDVGFTYPNGTRALQGVSLRIEPGERIAVVGRSGAGKTTVMKLLLRFYDPTEGAILLDDTEIPRFTVASLRDQIAVVQQDTVLFGLTIAENISLGSEESEAKAVRRSAKAVGAHSFIMGLPDGYDTKLSERGTTLSGGQRQRIALARALLRDAPILILDEPVNGLDAEVAQLAEAMWMAPDPARTVIVICHDYSLMDRYDRIVVLDNGRLLDVGTHAELSSRCESYRALHGSWVVRSQDTSINEDGSDACKPQRLAL
ncbi:MAG: ABC transporter ATP-binding protein [Planctomycetes bacterium]|nr:ABC transporter ATP-binding protein [Planctomycetota bacterium]